MKVRNLTKDALEVKEDLMLVNIAKKRMATFDRKTVKTHTQILSASKRPRR